MNIKIKYYLIDYVFYVVGLTVILYSTANDFDQTELKTIGLFAVLGAWILYNKIVREG